MPIHPQHRQAVEVLSEALQTVFGEHLKAILLKGSALKPDEFIPGYSDLDGCKGNPPTHEGCLIARWRVQRL